MKAQVYILVMKLSLDVRVQQVLLFVVLLVNRVVFRALPLVGKKTLGGAGTRDTRAHKGTRITPTNQITIQTHLVLTW